MTTAAARSTTASDVLWYIPNLIGYARVAVALLSFVLMALSTSATSDHSWWFPAIWLYIFSFVGDLFDGMMARKFDQCSVMGGLLDMVTDRCATLGLLSILSGEYAAVDAEWGMPVYRLLFLTLMLLDISSHWCQMYSSSIIVAGGAHHKSAQGNAGRHFLVQWFYQYYWFFGYLCVGAEFTYIALYSLRHAPHESFWYYLAQFGLYGCVPGCAAKQMVNLMQLLSACHIVAQHDAKTRNQRDQKDGTPKKE